MKILTLVCLVCFLIMGNSDALAQDDATGEENQAEDDLTGGSSLQVTRLDELARLLVKKTAERDTLNEALQNTPAAERNDERTLLVNLNRDIATLKSTFELVALEDTDTSVMDEEEESSSTWQEDIVEILSPLVDSLKSLTERPRQLAELRDNIMLTQQRMDVADDALAELEAVPSSRLTPNAAATYEGVFEKWQDEKNQLEQELLVARSQLERLEIDQEPFVDSIWPAMQDFLLGRGLTLLFAVAAAAAAWGLMKFFWWVYVSHLTSKEQRRTKTWFRLLAYSYYLLTTLVTFFSVVIVLYLREDLLLLAIALLLVVGAALSLRQFLPRYITEAKLLLNLGSVQEGERVVYNGLPWQVMSLNLHSVLRNPALDGVIRLPLSVIGELVSRPVKNNLWFPSDMGDYVVLPDETFGQIKTQTPDLVEISVTGGMTMTYSAADFYTINLRNLSRDQTFGVAVTFGLDYSLQAISLTEIPCSLESGVRSSLRIAELDAHLCSLIVELSAANASSLDFLLFAQFKSQLAGSYFKLQRLLLQACIAVSNEKGWEIPFPQLTVHTGAVTSPVLRASAAPQSLNN